MGFSSGNFHLMVASTRQGGQCLVDKRYPALGSTSSGAARQTSSEGRAQGQNFDRAPKLPTAILIDGAFFLRRFGATFPALDVNSPEDVALAVSSMATYHVAFRLGPKQMLAAVENQGFQPDESQHLYRIFFYDCPPLLKRIHKPISKRSVDLAKTPLAISRTAIHSRLRTVRKLALRLGRLNDSSEWRLTPDAMKRLAQSPDAFKPSDEDFVQHIVQKGVDMRLGLDVASLAYKKQADQIVLVAIDADFVPAAKLARREGIDVVIDPMWGTPAKDLVEHCDGVRSSKFPGRPKQTGAE